MDDFYVTLPSNVPNAPFPNTSSRYVTRLPEVLQLRKDKWMVALTDLVYSHSFVNVGKPLYYWIHFKSGRQPIRITFPSTQYLNLEQILHTLNTKTRAKRSANVEIDDVSKAKRAVELTENDQNLLDLINNRDGATPSDAPGGAPAVSGGAPGDAPEGAPAVSEGAPGVSLTLHQQELLDVYKKGKKGEKVEEAEEKTEEKAEETEETVEKAEKTGEKAEKTEETEEKDGEEPVKAGDKPVKVGEKPVKVGDKAGDKPGDKAGDKPGGKAEEKLKGDSGIILSEGQEEIMNVYNSGQKADGGTEQGEKTGSNTPQGEKTGEKTGETKGPVIDEVQKSYLELLEEKRLRDEEEKAKKEAEEQAAEEAKIKAEQEAVDAEKNRLDQLLELVNNANEVQNAIPEYKKMLETIENRPGDVTTYNALLEDFQKLRSIVSIDGNFFDVTPYVRFSDEHGRVQVDFLHSDVYFLEFEKPFSYFLGFDDLIVRNNSIAPHKVDLFGDVSVLYLYSDVVEPIIVGNKKTNLLSVIPCTGQYGSVVYYTVPNPRYVPIINSTIDSIRIELLTDGGTPIPFSWGTTISVLHFKRLKL